MSSFGETMRQIRLKKGLTQKRLYQEILSKSYAIRFEQGNHEISFFLLQQILARFPMDLAEFLYIHRGYRPDETEWFYAGFLHWGNRTDLQALRQFKQDYLARYPHSEQQAPRILQLELRLSQLAYYQASGKVLGDTVPETIKRPVTELLAAIQSWTIEDIRFASNTMDLITSEDLTLYFRTIMASLQRYRDFTPGKSIICVFLINAIHQVIFAEELVLATQLLASLAEFSQDETQMFYRNYAEFYAGIVQLLQGNLAAQTRANQAITRFRQLNYQHHAQLATATLDSARQLYESR